MMSKKIINIFIILLITTTVTLIPAVNSTKISKINNSKDLDTKTDLITNKKNENFEKKPSDIINRLKDANFTKYLSELKIAIEKNYKQKSNSNLQLIEKTFFNKLLNTINLENNTLFLIIFIAWVFLNGACAISFPEIYPYIVMMTESIAFGLIGSLITGLLFNMENHTILEGIYRIVNNSRIMQFIPGMKNAILIGLNITLALINSKSATIIAAVGWVYSTIALATFLYTFSNVLIVKLITSGIWFIMPYIIWKIIDLIYDLLVNEDDKNLLTHVTPYQV